MLMRVDVQQIVSRARLRGLAKWPRGLQVSQPWKRTNRQAVEELWLSQTKAKGNNAHTKKEKHKT